MRNGSIARLLRLSAILVISLTTGCASDTASREQLNTGYRELNSGNYEQALASAETFLRKTPSGPGSAEANYLEGRVYEQKAQQTLSTDPTSAKINLDAAATAYRKGLAQPSVPAVQALLHAGLANIAYHYDDYGSAVREWQVSFGALQSNDAKAWVLYRIGICQQRLGWFAQSDRSFAMVKQDFPASEPATRAASHIGATAFFVQVGAFTDLANATRMAGSLRKQGIASEVMVGPGGEVVRVGPAANYTDARTLQLRLVGQYPGAIVVP